MNDSDLDPMRVAPCKICGWSVEPGTDWGFLSDEMTYERCVDGCTHVHGQRRCDSCTRDWYRVGMDSSWDVDGCDKEDCPQCIDLNQNEVGSIRCGNYPDCELPATGFRLGWYLCDTCADRCEFCPDNGDDCLAEVTWESGGDWSTKYRLCNDCAKKAESRRRAEADWESRGDYLYDQMKDDDRTGLR